MKSKNLVSEKKPDRRAAYTRNAVKDALLALLKKNSFDRITVAAVCREADIGRATFYTHYDTLMDVIDELAEDAIKVTKSDGSTLSDSVRSAASELRSSKDFTDPDLAGRIMLMLPVCQRVADDPKYSVLFRDDAISQYIIMQVFRHEKGKKMEEAVNQYGLSEKEAEMLFLFAITGAFSVNRAMNWKKDADWLKVQRVLLTFLEGGYEALYKL